MNKPDAILTGDWHLRDTQPVARIDNFYEAQWEKIRYISELQRKYDIPILHSGDLFDNWRPSPMLLAKTISEMPNNFHTIYGNHDLPQHNLELAYKCGINVLQSANVCNVLSGTHWNQTPTTATLVIKGRQILIWHTMVWQGNKPWPDCIDPNSKRLLRGLEYDLVLTGHNHLPFTETYKERVLVNPGSIFRVNADQDIHKPRVYFYYAESNTVEAVYLPVKENVISTEHLDKKSEKLNRIEAFISGLSADWNGGMSFEENLEKFKKENEIGVEIMKIIYAAMAEK